MSDPRPIYQPAGEVDDFSPAAGLPDDQFIHDGLVTKRIIRASALAHLRPSGSELLWDLGAGAGSIMIEWLRLAPESSAIGVERNPNRLANGRANLQRFGLADRGKIIDAEVGEAIDTLPQPNAIFIGGGLSAGVLEQCLEKLAPLGRFVAHGVTIEAESELCQAQAQFGGELARIAVETSDTIGRFRGWKPLRTVTQWAWVKQK